MQWAASTGLQNLNEREASVLASAYTWSCKWPGYRLDFCDAQLIVSQAWQITFFIFPAWSNDYMAEWHGQWKEATKDAGLVENYFR
jgi:hypothetical protein